MPSPGRLPAHSPQDWESAVVSIFENHQDCWVIRIEAASVDSLTGLLAYMNVGVRRARGKPLDTKNTLNP